MASRVLVVMLVGAVCVAAEAGADDEVAWIMRSRLAVPADTVSWQFRGASSLALPALRTFYARRDYAPAWTGSTGFEPRARRLASVIRGAVRHGLAPQTYRADLIERLAGRPLADASASNRADIELLLTDSLLAYLRDLLYGITRGSETGLSEIDAAEALDPAELAAASLAAGDLAGIADRVAPTPAAYDRLTAALARLRALAAEDAPFALPDRTLRAGDRGDDVAALRSRLAFLGDLTEDEVRAATFDAALARALRGFQQRHGLESDGVAGARTRAALETPVAERARAVELNLERWRRLPRDPGTRYLLVNTAGQELEVVENRRRSLHMRVIVGVPFLSTPSFSSQIDTVVLNPYWEVPHSIAVNEILPELRDNPGYLAEQRMEVWQRGAGGSRVRDAQALDWSAIPARRFPYRFRQKPGPGNALGRVKFLMPNRYNVYLHDTPAKSLFAQAQRCFSHGCVRLEKPLELAGLVLQDEPGWAWERVEKTLETEQNYRIRLTRPVPVYLVYLTAWVDDRGGLHFRNDVYGRDGQLAKALERATSSSSVH